MLEMIDASDFSKYAKLRRKKLLDNLKEFSLKISDRLPGNNYYGFSAYQSFLPPLLKMLSRTCSYNMELPQPSILGPIWNYIDSGCSLVYGVHQIATWQNNSRPFATLIKGLSNVGSGSQLIALTVIGFGAIGFAAAFGAAFAMTLDDLAVAFRRSIDFNYWLKTGLIQLKELEDNIASLSAEINQTKDLYQFNKEKDPKMRWLLNRLMEQMKTLEENRNHLKEEILARLILKTQQPDPQIREIIHKNEQSNPGAFASLLVQICDRKSPNNLPEDCIAFLKLGDNYLNQCEDIVAKSQQHANKALLTAGKNSFIVGLAFAGMLMACIPGMQLAAGLLIAAASALYLADNVHKLPSGLRSAYHFFKTPNKSDFETTLTDYNDSHPENRVILACSSS